jgi:hypothetical protein
MHFITFARLVALCIASCAHEVVPGRVLKKRFQRRGLCSCTQELAGSDAKAVTKVVEDEK